MWKISESTQKPDLIDEHSSKTHVYIRKEIEEIEASEDRPKMFRYKEQIIPKKDWELYRQILNHDVEISEVQDALIELSAIIMEV